MERVCIEQVQLDPVTMKEAVARIFNLVREKRSAAAHVVTVNAQFMEVARRHVRFGNILRKADLSVADGMSLIWASRILGRRLPERVTGIDLVLGLCEEAACSDATIYLLGGQPGAADRAAKLLITSNPRLRVVGVDCPPKGFLNSPEELLRVEEKIRLAQPDLLFVALGAPSQEYWIDDHTHLPAKVMIGIGGTFEVIAGYHKRAPAVLQKTGCEWAWRLYLEPKRLWRRYLVGNTLFVYFVFAQMLREWVTASSRVSAQRSRSSAFVGKSDTPKL
jgi:N-acetylglucosaminyldiphosphoundecaprenol N-acetyl-beta-D-mannosaminyltransferase